jgi:hypothetical protein
MFESLGLVTLLLLSALLWYLGFLIAYLCDQKILCNSKIRFLGISPLLIFLWFFKAPLAARLASMNQVNAGPSWLIAILKFLQANPIVPAVLILLVCSLGGLYYLGIRGTRSDSFKLGLLISAIIISFLFPLTLAGLISAGWGASTALALLAEFLLFYFAKRKIISN